MMKFAFETVKDDVVRVLTVYNSKPEAMEHADAIKKAFAQYEGLLTLISADYDEDNNHTDNKCRVYEVWKWKGNEYA